VRAVIALLEGVSLAVARSRWMVGSSCLNPSRLAAAIALAMAAWLQSSSRISTRSSRTRHAGIPSAAVVGEPQREQPCRRADRAGIARTARWSATSCAAWVQPAGEHPDQEATEHPDRDAQFGYLNTFVKARLEAKYPVISVDTKKKGSSGSSRTAGVSLRPKGDPLAVNVHDFVTELSRAHPTLDESPGRGPAAG
jgi:hypothetical protein